MYLIASMHSAFGASDKPALHYDEILLTIHGNIDVETNTKFEFTLAALVDLEATTFTSTVPWTAMPVEYTGVRVSTLLEHIGTNSNQFIAMADNNYQFILSDIDFEKYPVIVAYQKNGEFFGVRELGPLLIMFPFDDYPELLTEKNKAASVWQLTELRIL